MAIAAKKKRPANTDDMPELSSNAKLLPRGKRTYAVPLQTLRVGSGKTQVDVAKATGIAQSEVSRVETKETLDDLQVSTLRRYVEAIGGRLDLVVTFPTGHVAKLAGAPRTT